MLNHELFDSVKGTTHVQETKSVENKNPSRSFFIEVIIKKKYSNQPKLSRLIGWTEFGRDIREYLSYATVREDRQ